MIRIAKKGVFLATFSVKLRFFPPSPKTIIPLGILIATLPANNAPMVKIASSTSLDVARLHEI